MFISILDKLNVNVDVCICVCVCSGTREHTCCGAGPDPWCRCDQSGRHASVSAEVSPVHGRAPNTIRRVPHTPAVWRSAWSWQLPVHWSCPLWPGMAGLRTALQGLPESIQPGQVSPGDALWTGRCVRARILAPQRTTKEPEKQTLAKRLLGIQSSTGRTILGELFPVQY